MTCGRVLADGTDRLADTSLSPLRFMAGVLACFGDVPAFRGDSLNPADECAVSRARAARTASRELMRPGRPPPDAILFAAGIVVIAWLGYSLFSANSRVVALQRALAENVGVGVRPSAVPPFPVTREDGGAAELAGFCAPDRKLLVVFSSPGCRACRSLEPEWLSASQRIAGLRLVVVSPDSLIGGAGAAPSATRTSAPGSAILAKFGMKRVPAAMYVDGRCTIRAMGTGTEAARAVLRLLDR